MNTVRYKDYVGAFNYDEDADLFHGRVVGLRDVVTFEGRSVDEIKTALADSIEDYLEFCRELGQEPEKPLSGRLLVRVDPDLHRSIATAATQEGKSLNGWIKQALARATQEPD
jgi:predicted HicB family RNase H-like nuclease